ncbi:MAG: TolC family protein, partial [Weeksellaceae bacterium]|nr:TolC family protein [Weeksellaceae bacterium]
MKNLISLLVVLMSVFGWSQQKWSLKECVDHAVENNLTIDQSRIQMQLAENDMNYTQNQWLPSVSGYFDYSLSLCTHHPAINKGYQQYSNSLGVRSSIVLYNG